MASLYRKWKQFEYKLNHPIRSAVRRKRRNNWWARYSAYLASPEWAEKRAERLRLDGGICRCGAPATHVHHLTYKRMGRERMRDLRSMCNACHEAAHKRKLRRAR